MKTKFISSLAFAAFTFAASADWTLSDDRTTISNGEVTINVTVTGNEIKLDVGRNANQTCEELDLSGKIVLSDGSPCDYEITEVAASGLQNITGWTKIVAPTTVRKFNAGQHINYTLREIIIDAPNLEEIGKSFYWNTGVTNLVLNAPNVRRIEDGAFKKVGQGGGNSDHALVFNAVEYIGAEAFGNCNLFNSVEIRSDRCTFIAPNAFAGAAGGITKLVLDVPNATSISSFTLAKCEIDISEWRLDSLESFPQFWQTTLVGRRLELPSLTNIVGNAFYGTTLKLTDFELSSPEKLTIANDAFNSCTATADRLVIGTKQPLHYSSSNNLFVNTQDVYFYGPAQPQDKLKLFIQQNNYYAKQITYKRRFFVSTKQSGWDEFIKPLDDADLRHAKYPKDLEDAGFRILGTSRAEQLGPAIVWFVHSPSPYDPKGLILVVK